MDWFQFHVSLLYVLASLHNSKVIPKRTAANLVNIAPFQLGEERNLTPHGFGGRLSIPSFLQKAAKRGSSR